MESQKERLAFLISIVDKEANHLEATTARLFQNTPATTQKVENWIADPDMSERLDAFVARYGRLQDTLGDKLIPAFLSYLGEPVGPAMDNLDKAERFGWITSSDDWMTHRKLRNQMIHEYIEDPSVLAAALEAGRCFATSMVSTGRLLAGTVRKRI